MKDESEAGIGVNRGEEEEDGSGYGEMKDSKKDGERHQWGLYTSAAQQMWQRLSDDSLGRRTRTKESYVWEQLWTTGARLDG